MSFTDNAFKPVVKTTTDFKSIEEYMKHVNAMKPVVSKKEENVFVTTRAKGRKLKKISRTKKIAKKVKITRSSSFGLKEISKNVKNIVKTLKRTTYKEISDIIINEYNESLSNAKDEKNIRRRIYDSLNVMKAMKLFKKDKYEKSILWNGDKVLSKKNSNINLNTQVSREDLEELSLEEIEQLFVSNINTGK
jgi:hypothetical protein